MVPHRLIAALLAVALPLGTPAAAWAIEQCCRSGPLAAVVGGETAATTGHCHGEVAAALPPSRSDRSTLVAAADPLDASGCRMDHAGLRSAAPDGDTATPLAWLFGSQPAVDAASAPGGHAALAAGRSPPDQPNLTLLHGVFRI